MIPEYPIMAALAAMLMVHIWFDRIYRDRRYMHNAKADDIMTDIYAVGEGPHGGPGTVSETAERDMFDHIRKGAQSGVDRDENRYGPIATNAICLAGMFVMLLFDHLGLGRVGWLALVLLPLPAFHLASNIINIRRGPRPAMPLLDERLGGVF